MGREMLGHIIRSVIAFAVAAASLQGYGLRRLQDDASVIVVGSVHNFIESRVNDGWQLSFTIEVARVLKGSVPGSTISVVRRPWKTLLINSGAAHALPQTPPVVGMWFLTGGASGDWDVLSPNPRGAWFHRLFLPALTPPPSGPYAYPADTPILDAMVYEVAAGAQATGRAEALLSAFDATDTPATRKVLADCRVSANPDFQAVGLVDSLGHAMPGAIQQLVRLWPSMDPRYQTWVADALAGWRDTDPEAVRQLGSLAAAPAAARSAGLREAAALALAAIHTKETLPFFAALLSSTDPGDQGKAVYAFGAFTNGCPIVTQESIVTMSYLQCSQPSSYKTLDTLAHGSAGPASGLPDRQAASASYWSGWWKSHPELH